MPPRQLNRFCSRELSHQCALLQAQTSSRFFTLPVSQQHSLCTAPANLRELASRSQLRLSEPQCSPNRRRHTPTLQSSRTAANLSHRLAKAMLPRRDGQAETYIAYGMTRELFLACTRSADYTIPQLKEKGGKAPKTVAGEDLGVGEGWWYQGLGLVPTFSTWSQITFLNMYLLTVRLRALPSHESFQTYSRHLIDHFSHEAEHRMDALHGLTSRTIRNKFLKDLFIQWRGVLAAYDEGLIKGDAVLGAAVWRNLWKASYTGPDGQEIEWEKVARVVAYMRRVTSELSKMSEHDLSRALGTPGGQDSVFSSSVADKFLVEAQQ
ncbi:ubiquinol-cytochrome C chaperone-domain-containing protein [Aspergillus filifer]